MEASIGAFCDDREIMTLIVLENKVKCHKGAEENSLQLQNSAGKMRKRRKWASRPPSNCPTTGDLRLLAGNFNLSVASRSCRIYRSQNAIQI